MAVRSVGGEGGPLGHLLPHGALPGAAPSGQWGRQRQEPRSSARDTPARRLQHRLDCACACLLHHVDAVPRGPVPLARLTRAVAVLVTVPRCDDGNRECEAAVVRISVWLHCAAGVFAERPQRRARSSSLGSRKHVLPAPLKA